MRRALSILVLVLLCGAGRSAAQTTTLDDQTANNTSACSGAATSPNAGCKGSFVGMKSSLSGT